jgi:hypothetical protein
LATIEERLGHDEAALTALAKAEASAANSKMISLRGYILAKHVETEALDEWTGSNTSVAERPNRLHA